MRRQQLLLCQDCTYEVIKIIFTRNEIADYCRNNNLILILIF